VPLQELDWNDQFGLESELTEEERLIQKKGARLGARSTGSARA
jgi:hypothetical protein